MDEESLAGWRVGASVQSKPTGLKDQREAGAVFERHLVRHPHDRLRSGIRDLRIPAMGEAGTVQQRHDPVAGHEAGSRWSAHDLAAHLDPGHEGQLGLHLVETGDHERVGKVDRSGADPDAYHAVGSLARPALLEFEGLRTAELPNHPGFHPGKATAGASTGSVKWVDPCCPKRDP